MYLVLKMIYYNLSLTHYRLVTSSTYLMCGVAEQPTRLKVDNVWHCCAGSPGLKVEYWG